MSTAKSFHFDARNLFSWQFLLLKILLLALIAVAVEKPSGALYGRIAMGEKAFGLHTYDVKANKVYVIAEGPRSGVSIERGVWVQPDGHFKFDHLPVGEYQLRVRAKGFSSAEDDGLFIEDGKVTEIPHTIEMELLQPSVSIAQTTRVFTSKDEASLFLNVTGANNGVVELYKTDFLPFLAKGKENDIDCGADLNIYISGGAELLAKVRSTQKPIMTRTCKMDLDWEDAAHNQINFGKLPKGDYLVYTKVDAMTGKTNAENATWFSVSDVGLVVKRDADKVIVRAIDLVTLKPVKDCSVKGYDITNKKIVTSAFKTNANGLLEINDSSVDHPKVLVPSGSAVASADLSAVTFFVGQAGPNMAYGGQAFDTSIPDVYKTYFYTDKPIYRLGQTVNYKGICRKDDHGDLKNPGAGVEIQARIEDPTQKELWKGVLKTDKYGTFHGTFTVPADGSTGGYQLITDIPDSNSNYGSFEVDEYRKPEFQVEVTSLTPRIVAGTKGRAQIKASYFFGAPVANAAVSYSIYSSPDWGTRWRLEARPDYYSFYDSWNDSDSYGAGGSLVTTGTAHTDENGLAIVEFDTAQPPQASDNTDNPDANAPYSNQVGDRQFRVEAEVTDISRMTQVASGSCQVTAGDFALFINPEDSVVKTGDSFTVDVQAINYDGTPVKNQPVTIQMERWTYDSVHYTYRDHTKVAELVCTTGADGKGKATITCKDQWPSDTFYISAVAKDAEAHKIADHTSIWVASERYAYRRDASDAEKETVSLTPNKKIYKPGETAKIMITAPITGKEGIEAIVTVEGERLYSCKVVPLDATAKLVEIPLSKELAPNAFIDIAFVGNKHQFYTAEQSIKVSPDDNFLKLAVSSDKDKYNPGETVHYTVKATRADGTPAANAEVSLGVVDESIYAVRAEQAEDIRKFFYSARSNVVLTACSFPLMYSAGPDKIEPKVRKDFRDTAAWMPDLVTNGDGIAIADVKLPDNLTTWRATARGVSMSTDVGFCTQKVLCTQDLILRLALPRFFNEGDQGYITAIVHNYTKKAQSIKLSLKASDQFKVQTATMQTASVEPEKAYRYSWPVTLAKSGMATVEAKAVGQTAGDAMEVKLPVNPLGLPAFSIKSGMLTADEVTLPIPTGMSSDAVKGTESAVLSLSSSTIGPVLGNFDKLIDYPYGCTEQTLSKMVPSIVAMQLHKQLNLPIAPEQTKKFAEVQKESLEKLRGYHHGDGGWGWWANDNSNAYLTAHVVDGLSMLKATGYSAEGQMIESGLRYLAKACFDLQKQLADPKLEKDDKWSAYVVTTEETDLAKMLYTVSEWGVTPTQLNDIYNPPKVDPTKVAPVKVGTDKNGKAITDGAAKTKATKPAPKQKPVLTFHSELTPKILPKAESQPPSTCKVRDWLVKNIDDLPEEALCYLILASKNLGDDASAQKAYKQLIKLSSTDASMMNWHATTYDYRFTNVEATALGLRAVLAMDPQNSERIEGIKQWLLLQRTKDGWENTKTTAEVFMALLIEEIQHKAQTPTEFQAKVVQDGQDLFNLAYDSTNMYGAEQKVKFQLTTKPSTMDLSKSGSGRLYWSTIVTYFRKLLPGDQTAGKGAPEGLSITRKFYRLVPLKDPAADGSIHFRSEEIVDHQIKAGETILMKTLVNSPIPLPYVKIESALPSGAEVVKADSRESSVDREKDGSGAFGDWGWMWWTHEDDLDDKIVYFGTSIPQGVSTFHTMMRMELPGKMEVLPTTLEGMYSDKIRGYSPLEELTVKE
jgi:alpha-2-macroglobulin